MTSKKNVLGEGNCEAAKKCDDATLAFVKSGRVDAAARAAALANQQEAAEVAAAEEAGKWRAKVPRRGTLQPDDSTPSASAPRDPLVGRRSRDS